MFSDRISQLMLPEIVVVFIFIFPLGLFFVQFSYPSEGAAKEPSPRATFSMECAEKLQTHLHPPICCVLFLLQVPAVNPPP